MPLISVIVPVYNVEKYLDECLESIVAQSYRHLEILVVDDGSTDHSGEMCDRWAERDERIKVIHQPNGGLSAARNTALDVMTGELVMMVDSDDVIHPQAAQLLLELLQRYDADMAIAHQLSFTSSEALVFPTLQKDSRTRCYGKDKAMLAILYQHGLTHSPCGRLYRASVFKDVRYPVGKLYEDIAVIYPLMMKCERIAAIDEYLYGYRQRTSSITGYFSPRRVDIIDTLEKLETQIEHENPQYLSAVRSRLLSAYFNILLLSNQDKSTDHSQLGDRCWKGIRRLRCGCLFDSKVRLKNKFGIIASYMGRWFLCSVLGKNYQPRP